MFISCRGRFPNLFAPRMRSLSLSKMKICLGRGSGAKSRSQKNQSEIEARAHALNFGDLKPGDFIVHKLHGIGVYEGLKVMPIQGFDAEFLQLKYKGNDRLYLPVYRVGQIQKYSGPVGCPSHRQARRPGLGKNQNKSALAFARRRRRTLDIYAKRAQAKRPPFHGRMKTISASKPPFLIKKPMINCAPSRIFLPICKSDIRWTAWLRRRRLR